eukprot:m.30040 g.30040  ORF g.30040 m.30040 type:complete len:400 (+) comp6749_c0_seq2:1125-2324(+)
MMLRLCRPAGRLDPLLLAATALMWCGLFYHFRAEQGRIDRQLESILDAERLVQEHLSKWAQLRDLEADNGQRAAALSNNVDVLRGEVARLQHLNEQLLAHPANPCPANTTAAAVPGERPADRMVADVPNLPFVYIITPTYSRPTQKADLIRLCYTLRLVPNVHWIVVEDADTVTPLVSRTLKQCNLRRIEQVAARTPVEHRRTICTTDNPKKGCPHGYTSKKMLEQSWMHPRGVRQRNAGLVALRRLQPWANPHGGAFYFADDDNTYSLELFEVIRRVALVSVWEVGLSGGLLHEGPILAQNGSIMKWHVGWKPTRPFPIDMAAFAVNVQALKDSHLEFKVTAGQGNLESNFLKQIVPGKEYVEAVRHPCNCILVWHTRTEHPLLNREKGTPSDPSIEV